MVKVEGTYKTVSGQEFADFYVALGVPKEEAQKAVGNHWTMKLWKEGETQWGYHLTCDEMPSMNSLETGTEGVERCFNHPLMGGKAKVMFTRHGDCFTTVTESEKFGKMVTEEKYSDEGIEMTITCKGKTLTEKWERCVKIDGAYIFEKGENLAAYAAAIGYMPSNVEEFMKSYKVHVKFDGNTFCMKEYFAGDVICNKLTLDVEMPFRYPDDKDEVPKRKGLTTKVGNHKFVSFIKASQGGADEEWGFEFTEDGLVMTGLEKKTNQTSKTYLKRFTDLSGTWKILSYVGVEEFSKAVGIPLETLQPVLNDTTARMTFTDTGKGCMRSQFISKAYNADISFKLNEEFDYYHPLFKQNMKNVATVNGNVFTMVSKTSMGTIVSQTHINDTFGVTSVCHLGCKKGYKTISERVC